MLKTKDSEIENEYELYVAKDKLLDALVELNHLGNYGRILPWYVAAPFSKKIKGRVVFLNNEIEKSLILKEGEQLFYLDMFLKNTVYTNYSWCNEFVSSWAEARSQIEANLVKTVTLWGFSYKLNYTHM